MMPDKSNRHQIAIVVPTWKTWMQTDAETWRQIGKADDRFHGSVLVLAAAAHWLAASIPLEC